MMTRSDLRMQQQCGEKEIKNQILHLKVPLYLQLTEKDLLRH